jgi:hypothetical protein
MKFVPFINKRKAVVFQLILYALISIFTINAQDNAYEYRDFLLSGNHSRQNLPPGWEYQTNSSNPHGIIVFLSANPRINEIPLQPGDFIGAFYTDDYGNLKCGGADFWLEDENIIFGAFGNDSETPEKDGFFPGETMYFKVFLQETQKEYDVDLMQFDPSYSSTNKWYPLGLSGVINLLCEVTFDAYATVSPGTICLGDGVELQTHIFIETTGAYTFMWSSLPEGFSSSQANVTAFPVENTFYLLEVSDGNEISNHQVAVTVHQNPTVFAGDDFIICAVQPAILEGTASDYSTISWSTSGDGSFENPAMAETIYYPGPADIANNGFIATLSAEPPEPCTIGASDEVIASIQPLPQIITEPSLVFCISAPVLVEAEINNHSDFEWTTSGDGTFEDAQEPATQYFPGTADQAAKSFFLTAMAEAVVPCDTTISQSVSVNLTEMPTLNAPSTRLICEGAAANLNGVAFNYSTIQWSTAGDGTFSNPVSLNTQYFPGEEDISSGGAAVTVSAFGINQCLEYSTDKIVQIVIMKNPTVETGNDLSVCGNSPVNLNASAENYSFVLWSTNGDGFFTNPGAMNTIYFPGLIDQANGSVSLMITANPVSPCTASSTDMLTVFLTAPAQAGINPSSATICYDENYTISGANLQSVSTVTWFTTNGSGTFDDPGLFNPTYFPNPDQDYDLGCIVIGVAAQPIEPCTSTAYAYMSLCFNPPPVVFAGSDQTILTGETVTITDAMADNFTSALWQTTGDGTFANPEQINTEYYPGNVDKYQQQTEIFLTAQPLTGCNIAASDTLFITIFSRQTIVFQEGLNGFSVYINNPEMAFDEMVQQFAGKIKYAQMMNQVFWPEYDINTISPFSNKQGYTIYFNDTATTEFTGPLSNEKTISLTKGWNIMPVLSKFNLDGQEIIDQLEENLIIVTEINGNKSIYIPQNIFTLQTLSPGKAYMIKVAENTSFTFPDCPAKF